MKDEFSGLLANLVNSLSNAFHIVFGITSTNQLQMQTLYHIIVM